MKKRLCVFYYKADEWSSRNIEWIVCKACQRLIKRGLIEVPTPQHRK